MPPNIAGNWPPHDIDHRLVSAPKSDWAWEFLRRNAEYRRAAAGAQCEMVRLDTIDVAVPVFRLNRYQEAAQNWALCSFRRPNPLRKHRFRLLERRSPTLLGAGPCPARASRCRPPTRSRYWSVGYRPWYSHRYVWYRACRATGGIPHDHAAKPGNECYRRPSELDVSHSWIVGHCKCVSIANSCPIPA
jgi:hypothetical protein